MAPEEIVDGRGGASWPLDPDRPGLYRSAGIASLLIVLAYILALAIYVPGTLEAPAPATVAEWFQLFQDDPTTALFYLGLADIAIVILFLPVAIALWSLLSGASWTWATIAVPLAVVGAAVYLATNTAFSMQSLTADYVAATTEAERATALAAGQAILSISRGTGGMLGLALVWLANLVYAILMLRLPVLGRATAWIGVISFTLLVPSFLFAGYTYGEAEGVGAALALITSVGGGLFSLAWFIMLGMRLLKLARSTGG